MAVRHSAQVFAKKNAITTDSKDKSIINTVYPLNYMDSSPNLAFPSETALCSEEQMRRQVEATDTSLFRVKSQTSLKDQETLLLLQAAVGRLYQYVYLEVGSHLGGTLCPHLLDPRCKLAISIDPRPSSQPDERGRSFEYAENSTTRMLQTLSAHVPASGLLKLLTFDCDASRLSITQIPCKVDLALIDGEHTNRAAFRDFISILPMLNEDAMVVFHDAQLIHDSISNIEQMLSFMKRPYYGCYARDHIYAVGLGSAADIIKTTLGGVRHDTDSFLDYARRQVRLNVAVNYPLEMLKDALRKMSI
jgi:hypothetical protein